MKKSALKHLYQLPANSKERKEWIEVAVDEVIAGNYDYDETFDRLIEAKIAIQRMIRKMVEIRTDEFYNINTERQTNGNELH